MRLGALLGFAVGYTLGSRAGRERFEQIQRLFNRAKATGPGQQVTEEAQRLGETVQQRTTEAVAKAGDRVSGRGGTGADDDVLEGTAVGVVITDPLTGATSDPLLDDPAMTDPVMSDPLTDATVVGDPTLNPAAPVDPMDPAVGMDPADPIDPAVDPIVASDPLVDPAAPVNPVLDPAAPVDVTSDPTGIADTLPPDDRADRVTPGDEEVIDRLVEDATEPTDPSADPLDTDDTPGRRSDPPSTPA